MMALKFEQILKLLEDRRSGMSYRQLARKYEISKATAWNYVHKFSENDVNSKLANALPFEESSNKGNEILAKLDFQPSNLFQGEETNKSAGQQQKSFDGFAAV